MGTAELSSSSSSSLTTLAFQRLRADIVTGALLPEQRLRIQALGKRYEIGATAIREALSRLTSDGLVEFQEQRGFRVAPVSREELQDLTQTRIDLDCIAVRRAIERGGIDWESNVVSHYHRLSKTTIPTSPELFDDWLLAHNAFHESLLAGCQSPTTLQLCRLVREKLARYHNLSLRNTTLEDRATLDEHKQLADAVISRDAPLAQELISEHFARSAEFALLAFDKAFPVDAEAVDDKSM
ncbi:FCD domain-containing protein [Alcaligenes sp. 1735tsa3]|nr:MULTISPECIES: FCD domain-containing protein [Alcaligenes]USY25976.1 FCD domain-containing protein [Alcaligenes sp. 1735tsa3]